MSGSSLSNIPLAQIVTIRSSFNISSSFGGSFDNSPEVSKVYISFVNIYRKIKPSISSNNIGSLNESLKKPAPLVIPIRLSNINRVVLINYIFCSKFLSDDLIPRRQFEGEIP